MYIRRAYKVRQGTTKTFPVFINYDKSEDISDYNNTKYERPFHRAGCSLDCKFRNQEEVYHRKMYRIFLAWPKERGEFTFITVCCEKNKER